MQAPRLECRSLLRSLKLDFGFANSVCFGRIPPVKLGYTVTSENFSRPLQPLTESLQRPFIAHWHPFTFTVWRYIGESLETAHRQLPLSREVKFTMATAFFNADGFN
jgi:hypothetical protein